MNRSMKQMLSALLAVAMVAALLVVPSIAADKLDDGTYKLTADTTPVTVKVGETAEVAASAYKVQEDVSSDIYVTAADTNVATATFAGGKVTITGVAAGTTSVAVAVKGTDLLATIPVTVEADSSALTFAVTEASAGTYAAETKIGGVEGVDVYVSADKFTYKTDDWSAKTSYAGYIVGGANGKVDATTNEPSGCYYKFDVSKSGTLKVDYLINADKDFYVLDKVGDTVTVLKQVAKADNTEKHNGTETIEAKAGHSYYVLCTGSKLCFYGMSFEAAPVPTFAVSDASAGTYAAETKIGSLDGMDIYVSADKFTYKTDDWSSKTSYAGYIVGGANGKVDATTNEPSGCYYKFVASENGVLKVDYLINADKDFYVLDKFGDTITVLKQVAKADNTEKHNGTETIEAKGNHTYYVLCTGSKLCFYGLSFEVTGGPVEDPNPSVDPDPEETVYTVTADAKTVTVTVDSKKTVNVTVDPAGEIYAVSADTSIATVTVANGKVTVTGVKAGKTTVTVGVKDGIGSAEIAVTVNAKNSGGGGGSSSRPNRPGTSDPVSSLPFSDVKVEDWFYESVKKAFDKGLMKGTSDTTFAPNDKTTRAMVATVLFRLDGEKKTDVENLFNDVVADSWYTDAVAWAAEKGIVKGYDENTFAPNDNVTREQLVVMLYRYAAPEAKSEKDLSAFTDAASVSEWATEAMTWAVENGIILGRGNNQLDPQGLASRAEICTVLVRFLEMK